MCQFYWTLSLLDWLCGQTKLGCFSMSRTTVLQVWPRPRKYRLSEIPLLQTPSLLGNIRLAWIDLFRDKHYSLLWKSVNYGRKKFYSTGPWLVKLENDLSEAPIGLINFQSDKMSYHLLFGQCLVCLIKCLKSEADRDHIIVRRTRLNGLQP